jgi:predicted O-methyltransferase YrrM
VSSIRHPEGSRSGLLRLPRNHLLYAVHVLQAFARDPLEALGRFADRLSEWQDSRKHPEYEASPAWEGELHALLDAPWPCPDHRIFAALWRKMTTQLRTQGLSLGRGAYGGWDDADSALARAVWCSTLHTHPETVVETGVARGITSYFILDALERNGAGHLWSIDIPPLVALDLRSETGAAVPEGLRHRWTYVEGSSRARLPGLLAQLPPVDLFVHDSMHTKRNVDFELDCVWPALHASGILIADDIQRSASFADQPSRHADGIFVVGTADDGRANIGIAKKLLDFNQKVVS